MLNIKRKTFSARRRRLRDKILEDEKIVSRMAAVDAVDLRGLRKGAWRRLMDRPNVCLDDRSQSEVELTFILT